MFLHISNGARGSNNTTGDRRFVGPGAPMNQSNGRVTFIHAAMNEHAVQRYIERQNHVHTQHVLQNSDAMAALGATMPSPVFAQRLLANQLPFGSTWVAPSPVVASPSFSPSMLLAGNSPELTQHLLSSQTRAVFPNLGTSWNDPMQQRSFLHAQMVNRILNANANTNADTITPKPESRSTVPQRTNSTLRVVPKASARVQDGSCLPNVLAQPTDVEKLSSLQVLLRHQIEVFAATEQYVSTHIRGRTKLVRLNQVGIRCRHCASLPLLEQPKGSAYFPSSVRGFYQASQNMNLMHFQGGACAAMPAALREQFALLAAAKSSGISGAGRKYWANGAREKLNLVDTDKGIYFAHCVPCDAAVVEKALVYQSRIASMASERVARQKRERDLATAESSNKRTKY